MPCSQTGTIDKKRKRHKVEVKEQAAKALIMGGLMDTSDVHQIEDDNVDDREFFNTMQTDDSPINYVNTVDPYERSPTWKSDRTHDDSESYVSSYHSSNH